MCQIAISKAKEDARVEAEQAVAQHRKEAEKAKGTEPAIILADCNDSGHDG